MATLTAASLASRPLNDRVPGDLPSYPCVGNDIVFAGAWVGLNSGNARPLVAGDTFAGLCMARADNTGGAAGDLDVETLAVGVAYRQAVAGSGAAGADVSASDAATLTFTSTATSKVGYVQRVNADGTFDVFFKGAARGGA